MDNCGPTVSEIFCCPNDYLQGEKDGYLKHLYEELRAQAKKDAPRNTCLVGTVHLAVEALETAGKEFQEIIEESNKAFVKQLIILL